MESLKTIIAPTRTRTPGFQNFLKDAQTHLILFFVAFVGVRLVVFSELSNFSDDLVSFLTLLACRIQRNGT